MKVDKAGPDECWLWNTHANNKGYGALAEYVDGVWRKSLAHRVSYELAHGPVPNRMKVLHRCDTPRCVNPAHLFLGTMKQNTEDMVAKGRSARGERHGSNKLSADDVVMIRSTYSDGGVTLKALAAFFGVSAWAVSDIVRNRNWKWLQPKGEVTQ